MRRLIVGCALLALAACAAPGFSNSPLAATAPESQIPSKDARTFLYVGGLKLSKFGLDSSKPLRSTKVDYYIGSVALALDSDANLCEANGNPSYPQMLVYDARSLKLTRALDSEAILSLAVDRFGYVYGAGGTNVKVFAPGCTHVVNTIRAGGSAFHLIFDGTGNLYVAEAGSISVYTPAKTPGHVKLLRRIREGIHNPTALAFSPSGDLYVANAPGCNPPCGKPYIAVYGPNGSKPMRTITDGAEAPGNLAVDSNGLLYVANSPVGRRLHLPGWVSVYPAGGSHPIRKITDGIRRPHALALDPSGDLYVGNEDNNSVTVYSPGGVQLLRKITKGIDFAVAILIGSP
jgi:hypothetical protein